METAIREVNKLPFVQLSSSESVQVVQRPPGVALKGAADPVIDALIGARPAEVHEMQAEVIGFSRIPTNGLKILAARN